MTTALLTRSMTQAQARATTADLLREHGLKEWAVAFSNAKRTAGVCNHRMKTITLSRYLLAQRSYEDSMMTITHEIAHALTPWHNHDYVWQRQHRALGGNGKRCFEHVDEQAPWTGTCPHGQTYHRYRKPLEGRTWYCRHPRKGLIVWERNR